MKIQQILDLQGIVHTAPEIMRGVPVFVGTRVPLTDILHLLIQGRVGTAHPTKK